MTLGESLGGDKPAKYPGRLIIFAAPSGMDPEEARQFVASHIPAGAEILAESHYSFVDRIAFKVCDEHYAPIQYGCSIPLTRLERE